MEVSRIFNWKPFFGKKAEKKSDAEPANPSDSFQKSKGNSAETKSKLNAKTASQILFAKNTTSDPKDPFGLKADGMMVSAAVTDPDKGVCYMGLKDRDDKEFYLASYDSDNSIKWKVPLEKSPDVIALDNRGGAVLRSGEKILSFDEEGNKNWEYSPENANDNFKKDLVAGNDGTVYFTYGNPHGYETNEWMSLAAVKDGKCSWVYKCGGFKTDKVSLEVSGKGDVYFTVPDGRKSDSEIDEYTGRYKNKYFMVGLDSNGQKKFEKEVGATEWFNAKPTESPDGSLLYFSESGHKISSMAPDGTEKWSLKLEGRAGLKPSVRKNGDILLATGSPERREDQNRLLYIDGKDGKVKWQTDIPGNVKSLPATDRDEFPVKVFDTMNGVRFIKFNDSGRQLGIFNYDHDGIGNVYYMGHNEAVVGSDENSRVRVKTRSMPKIDQNQPELTNTGEENLGETPVIKEEKNHVLIGGIRLRKRK